MANKKPVTISGGQLAEISSSDTLAVSLLESLSTLRVVVTDSSGKLTVSTVTPTKLDYLLNVTSDLQTQIDNKASTLLDNLGTTNINAALLFQTGLDIGSTAKPARNLYVYLSGTYGTGSVSFAGTPTANRVVTFPDASIVFAGSSSALTSGRVPYVTTGGLLTDSALFQYNGGIYLEGANVPSLTMVKTSTLNWVFGGDGTASNYFSFIFNGVKAVQLGTGYDVTIGNGAPIAGAQFVVYPLNASTVTAIIRGAASQSANLTEWQNSAGTVLASVSAAGAGTFAGLTNSAGTSGRIPYYTTGGLLTDASDFTWDATAGSKIFGRPEMIQFGASGITPPAWSGSAELINQAGVGWTVRSNVVVFQTGPLIGGRPTYDTFSLLADSNVTINGASGLAQLAVLSHSASNVGQIIRGAASQSANLTEWQNSAGTVLASVSAAGAGTFAGLTNSAGTSGRIPYYTTGGLLTDSASLTFSGGAFSVTGNALISNTLVVGSTTAASSGNIELWANGGTYPTVFQIKNTDFVLASAGGFATWGFGAATGDTYSRLQSYTNGGNSVGNFALNPIGGAISINTASLFTASLNVVAPSASVIGQIIRGAASQSAALTEWQNLGGTVLASVSAAGAGTFAGLTNSSGTSGRVPYYTTGGLLTDSANATLDSSGNMTLGGQLTADTLQMSSTVSAGIFQARIIGADGADRDIFIAGALGLSNGFQVKRVSSAMRYIFQDGNLGVNSTVPAAQLDVRTGAASTIGAIVRGASSQSANLTEWQNSAGTILARVNASGVIYTSEVQLDGAAGRFYISGGGGTFSITSSGSAFEFTTQGDLPRATFSVVDTFTLGKSGDTIANNFLHLQRVSSTQLDMLVRGDLGVGTHIGSSWSALGARLDVQGRTLNTDADGTIGVARFQFTVAKNDSNTRTFSGLQIKPTLNTGGSNANTTIDVLQIDTTNTATTGLTVNLIDAMYGGVSKFAVNSSGGITSAALTSGRVTFATTAGLLTDSANLTVANSNNSLYINGSDASPRLRLSGGTNPYFYIVGAAATGKLQVIDGGTNAIVYGAESSHKMGLLTNNLTRLLIDENGIVNVQSSGSYSAFQTSAQFGVVAGSAATVGQIIRGAASQSANLQEWQNSSAVIQAKVAPNGIITSGDGTGAAGLVLNGLVASSPSLTWQQAGVIRWLYYTTGNETGSDAGSNLVLGRAFNDAGTGIDNPITIARAAGGAITIVRPITLSDVNFVLGTTTGTKFGTSTSQKIGFYNATPIVQPSGDILTALSNLGLIASPTITSNQGLEEFYSDATNTSTSETDIYSYTLAAGKLASNGDKVMAEYGGTFVSSGTATRQVKVYFGGTAIFDTGMLSISTSSSWTLNVLIVRVSSTTVRYKVELNTQGAALSSYTSVGELGSLTLSNTQVLKLTGTAAGVGAATADITAKLGKIDYQITAP